MLSSYFYNTYFTDLPSNHGFNHNNDDKYDGTFPTQHSQFDVALFLAVVVYNQSNIHSN